MSASGGGSYDERVRSLFQQAADAGSIGGVLFRGIGASLLAIGSVLASGVLTIGDIFIIPAQAFIEGVSAVVTSLYSGFATIINAGAIASALSIGPGGLFASPLSFPFAIGIGLLGAYAILAYISEEDTTNFFPLIGSGWDVPTPGWMDSEEEEEG